MPHFIAKFQEKQYSKKESRNQGIKVDHKRPLTEQQFIEKQRLFDK